MLDIAKRMKSLGLYDAGYNWVNLDDCYAEKSRNAEGNIVEDQTRFKGGMKNLTSQIKEQGFHVGIYGDSGWYTCAGYPGSFRNEKRDARTFHDWGFELLKFDTCAVPYDSVIQQNNYGKFKPMSDAIIELAEETGTTPMIYSLCSWGWQQVWLWAHEQGQAWRTTQDIEPNWKSISYIINNNSFITQAADFYGHNDLDILEVGNGELDFEESKSHFTAWAFMKSPLLVSTDLTNITDASLSILTNQEIIAINQDDVVGTSISPFKWGYNQDWTWDPEHPAEYWSGRSQNGTVVMLLNTEDKPKAMTFQFHESPWLRVGRKYSIRDLWAHTDNGTASRAFTAEGVPRHGVVALLLKDAGPEDEGIAPPCNDPRLTTTWWWGCTQPGVNDGPDGATPPEHNKGDDTTHDHKTPVGTPAANTESPFCHSLSAYRYHFALSMLYYICC